jgi:hypothetical protein
MQERAHDCPPPTGVVVTTVERHETALVLGAVFEPADRHTRLSWAWVCALLFCFVEETP